MDHRTMSSFFSFDFIVDVVVVVVLETSLFWSQKLYRDVVFTNFFNKLRCKKQGWVRVGKTILIFLKSF